MTKSCEGVTLVIGCGSIGRRHLRLLHSFGRHAAVVSRHVSGTDGAPEAVAVFRSLEEAWAEGWPQRVLICNKTCDHHTTLEWLLNRGYDGPILVEKPLLQPGLPAGAAAQLLTAAREHGRTFTAYNLRFHPVLQQLKRRTASATLLSMQVYAGQDLRRWRSGDYRCSYSARRSEGGGVLCDLSHELDYVQWLCGPWQRVAAIGGQFSRLEVDSDDVYALLLSTARCPIITVQLNYTDQIGQRQLILNTDCGTYTADLLNGTLTSMEGIEHYSCERDDTYRAQLKALLDERFDRLCNLEQAWETLRLIAGCERAAQLGRWIAYEE